MRRPRPAAARTVSTERFRNLPRAFDPLMQVGAERVLRWQWVHSALMAIIASTTPSGRWLILHNGFQRFQFAGAAFDATTNYTLDTNELRAVFDGIAEYVHRRERHMSPIFADLYAKELRRTTSTHLFEDAKPAILTPHDIAVEKVKDGSLRRVQ